jgi:nuclear pore complex protein Nup107
VETYPYDLISKEKSFHTLGRSINIANDESTRRADADEIAARDLMYRQSRAYYHMEQLVHAFEALSRWREEELLYREKIPIPSSVPIALKQAYEAVETTMAPLLQDSFLLYSIEDDDDAADAADDTFTSLRDLYLPEALIAYNTVLHSAGYLITRDSLLKSMDLSVAVANEDNRLTGPLVRAGRMRELVRSFALSAKAMLVLKGLGHKPWRTKKDREGKDPGIWEIGPQGGREEEEVEMEAEVGA